MLTRRCTEANIPLAAVTSSKLLTSLTRCSATISITSIRTGPRHISFPWRPQTSPLPVTCRLTSHLKSSLSMMMHLRLRWASNASVVASLTMSTAKMAVISAVVKTTRAPTREASASRQTLRPMTRSTRRGAIIGCQVRNRTEEDDGCQGGPSISRLEGISKEQLSFKEKKMK